jgi:hypothetical protein
MRSLAEGGRTLRAGERLPEKLPALFMALTK